MQVNRWNPELRRWLVEASRAAGFDAVGIVEVRGLDDPAVAQQAELFSSWIDAGHAGEMDYLKRRDEAGTLVRGNLRVAMPWARSAIVCAMNYNFVASSVRSEDRSPRSTPPRSIDPAPPGSVWIARYAWTGHTLDDGSSAPTDYHVDLLSRLRAIDVELLARAACTTRCYVDTGPLVERSLAAVAGIGWIGKNTCLISQQLGSWLLLGVLVTSLPMELAEELKAEQAREVKSARVASSLVIPAVIHSALEINADLIDVSSVYPAEFQAPDRCGTCTRCIDACPTGALLGSRSPDAPRTMDASRCIAYLTIEKKGPIDPSLRAPMGRQVFGCDICQDVCPWNRRAPIAESESIQPRSELINPPLDWLAAMDASQFKRLFKGSPLERTGRKRLLRNVAIAMGNSGEARFVPQLDEWAVGDDPVLADAAAWARSRLLA